MKDLLLLAKDVMKTLISQTATEIHNIDDLEAFREWQRAKNKCGPHESILILILSI